jgi:hypothetical protein
MREGLVVFHYARTNQRLQLDVLTVISNQNRWVVQGIVDPLELNEVELCFD